MTTPIAGVTHHITLQNGTRKMGFMLDLRSDQSERADDFAPRIASGSDTATQQGLWDSWAHTGFSEGIDQYEFLNGNKIYRSDGNVFGYRDGAVTLDAQWAASDASKVATSPQIIDFGTDTILVGVGTKVRRYSVAGGTWADSTTTLAASVISLHKHGANAFAAVSGANEFYRSSDGDTWSQITTTPASQPATCFATWEVAGGTVYLVIAQDNTIKLSSDDGVTFGSAINIGDASTNVTAIAPMFGVLVIRKEDGLYYYDGTTVRELWRHRNTKYSGNKCLAYLEGFCYLNSLNKVYKISLSDGNISNFQDVTPYMKGDEEKDLYGHGIPVAMWDGNGRLYVAFDDGENVYPEVMTLNSTGAWQQAYRGTSGDTMLAGGYSQLAGRTFLNDGSTRARRHVTAADAPFPDYPSSGQFITSIHIGGKPFMLKAYRELSLQARNLSSAAGRQISVEYSNDRGVSWTAMGTMTADGRTELQFDQDDAIITSMDLILRFTLTRGSTATETPVLEKWATSFLLRPTPIYAYSVSARVGPNVVLLDNSQTDDVTPAEQLDFLKLAEASDSVVRYVDKVGTQHMVLISKTRERTAFQDTPGDIERDTRIVDITMIDAVAGLWPQMVVEMEIELESITFTLIDYVAAVWDTPNWGYFQWE